MVTCTQCGKAAIVTVAAHPLCVECHLKLQQAFEIRDRALKAQINFLLDQADAVTGINAGFGRYDLSPPVIHRGNMTLHTINVKRSVIGAINTGTVRQMEVALNHVHVTNENAELEAALKTFAEEVLVEASLNVEAKREILEQLTALTEQLALPKEYCSVGAVKAFILSIGANIASSQLAAHWDVIKHLLRF